MTTRMMIKAALITARRPQDDFEEYDSDAPESARTSRADSARPGRAGRFLGSDSSPDRVDGWAGPALPLSLSLSLALSLSLSLAFSLSPLPLFPSLSLYLSLTLCPSVCLSVSLSLCLGLRLSPPIPRPSLAFFLFYLAVWLAVWPSLSSDVRLGLLYIYIYIYIYHHAARSCQTPQCPSAGARPHPVLLLCRRRRPATERLQRERAAGHDQRWPRRTAAISRRDESPRFRARTDRRDFAPAREFVWHAWPCGRTKTTFTP